MKVLEMEHYDDFDDDYVFWVCVQDIPAKFIQEAKQIDKENYLPTCFGICVCKDEDGWGVCQDSPGCELYYIDNNGYKHWMEYLLSDVEKENAVEYCKTYIKGDM